MTPPAIILVAPTGDRNIGSVARVMKNFGMRDLRLVRPATDHCSRESRRMAMKAGDVLENAAIHESLSEALKDCSWSIATTGRTRTLKRNLESLPGFFNQAGDLDLSNRKLAFIFGTEESGLANEDLEQASRLICIPTSPEYPSLNLAQAVGLVCYEWSQSSQASLAQASLPSGPKIVPIDRLGREQLLTGLEHFLRSVGFINDRTRNARMRRLMDVFDRAQLSDSDGRFIGALFHFVRSRIR